MDFVGDNLWGYINYYITKHNICQYFVWVNYSIDNNLISFICPAHIRNDQMHNRFSAVPGPNLHHLGDNHQRISFSFKGLSCPGRGLHHLIDGGCPHSPIVSNSTRPRARISLTSL